MAERVDREELERRKATAEFLRAERERYEYLLVCARDADDEELAWETIVARMAVEDFVTAAKEVLAARRFRDDIHSALQPGRWRGWDGPDGVDVREVIEDVARALERHDQAAGSVAKPQPDPAAGHADPAGPP